LYADDRDRIVQNVKESVEEAGQNPEDSAYYFVIGLCVAVFVGLIVIIANIKTKTNELQVYRQKTQEEVTKQLSSSISAKNQIEDLNSQVEVLRLALSQRIDFSRFFKDLSSNQYQRSRWTDITLDSNKIAISMEADSFDDLNKSVKSLQNIPAIKTTSLSDVDVNPDSQKIQYIVELTVDFNSYRVGAR